jgi:hypothetical protein
MQRLDVSSIRRSLLHGFEDANRLHDSFFTGTDSERAQNVFKAGMHYSAGSHCVAAGNTSASSRHIQSGDPSTFSGREWKLG